MSGSKPNYLAIALIIGGIICSVFVYKVYQFNKLEHEVFLRTNSKMKLKSVGRALGDYTNEHEEYPNSLRDGLSWQARLLPFLGQDHIYQQIEFSEPWDSSSNLRIAESVIEDFQVHSFDKKNANGIALSHFAGNKHVFDSSEPVKKTHMQHVLMNSTILAFEISNGFMPWMDPSNLRDPMNGFGNGENQIGGVSIGGCNVLLSDGTVIFLSENTDAEIIECLSTITAKESPCELFSF